MGLRQWNRFVRSSELHTEHEDVLRVLDSQRPSVAAARGRWVVGGVRDERSRRARVGLEVGLKGVFKPHGARDQKYRGTDSLSLGKTDVVVGGVFEEVLVVNVVLAR